MCVAHTDASSSDDNAEADSSHMLAMRTALLAASNLVDTLRRRARPGLEGGDKCVAWDHVCLCVEIVCVYDDVSVCCSAMVSRVPQAVVRVASRRSRRVSESVCVRMCWCDAPSPTRSTATVATSSLDDAAHDHQHHIGVDRRACVALGRTCNGA
jgi:hypothetical protein